MREWEESSSSEIQPQRLYRESGAGILTPADQFRHPQEAVLAIEKEGDLEGGGRAQHLISATAQKKISRVKRIYFLEFIGVRAGMACQKL
jgi:hypothetical protein